MTIKTSFYDRLGGRGGYIGIATQDPFGDMGCFLTDEATHSTCQLLNDFLLMLEHWNPSSGQTYSANYQLWSVHIQCDHISLAGLPEYLPDQGVTVSIRDFVEIAKQWKAKLIEHHK